MKSRIFLFLLAAFSSAWAQVTVLESTPSRLVFQWEIQDYKVSDDGGLSRLSFTGENMACGGPGKPLFPARSVYAGVPQEGDVHVSVSVQDVQEVSLKNAPEISRFEDAFAPVFSQKWVSEPVYSNFRNYRSVNLAVCPFLDLGNNRIQVLRKAVITISFGRSVHTGRTWKPSGDYERMVARLLLNFNVAQGWVVSGKRLRKTAESDFPFSSNQKLYTFRVGDGNRNLNETSIKENGVVKINGSRIRSLFGTNVNTGSVSIYASVKGELNQAVPEEGKIPAGIDEIPLLRFDFNDNGIVDSEDYFLAYVSGSSDWGYDSFKQQYVMNIDKYDDYRTYWLTVNSGSSATMQKFVQPQGSAEPLNYFENNLYLRNPQTLSESNREGGTTWIWKRIESVHPDTTLLLNLPGLERNMPGAINFIRGSVSYRAGIRATLGSSQLCEDCRYDWYPVSRWNSELLKIGFKDITDQTGYYELSGVHIRYMRKLEVGGSTKKLTVFSINNTNMAHYQLQKADNDLAYIFRVPVDEKQVSLVDSLRNPQGGYFSWTDSGMQGIRYMVLKESEVVDMSDSLKLVDQNVSNALVIKDLRDQLNTTDYLIVTHSDFLSQAIKLAEHKRKIGFSMPKIVLINDVYNQFSGGNTDPVALRNFFLYVYRNWNKGAELSYVVLFGSGHYDYKFFSTHNPNFIPTGYIGNKCSDDFFVFLDSQYSVDNQHEGYYLIGRLPAKSQSEASSIVNKIIDVEDPDVAEYDSWRNRVVMAADDDQQGTKYDEINRISTPHHESSDHVIAAIEQRRPYIDVRKLYLFEYEWNDQYAKPGATRALLNEINNGAAAVNWFGHGANEQWADEFLFTKEDVVGLFNRKRYPLFSTFSCSVGKFDLPNDECLSALLVKQAEAGAIATVSSTREVYASENEKLAIAFYESLFDSTENLSIGAALKFAKSNYRSQNNRAYVLLGDPSVTLMPISRRIDLSLTSQNGKALDTLKALQEVKLSGRLIGKDGTLDTRFGGSDAFVQLTLYNAPDSTKRKDGGAFSDPTYVLPGIPIFSSKVPVKSGLFEQTVLVPMSLSFNKPGVKLTAYAWSDSSVGAGCKDSLIFNGTESRDITDTTGPRVSIRPVYNSQTMDQAGLFVKNRITSRLPLKCELSIFDESGINVVGAGPDEGMGMEVKGALSKRAINHLFQFSEGDFRRGVAVLNFEEGSLETGTHNLMISAQDLLGNISQTSITLEVLDEFSVKLDHCMNVPNPVRMGQDTRFYFYHSSTDQSMDLTITIKVYTLGGRLLKIIRNPQNGEAWVPRDEKGNLLTPNVYLYQVTATAPGLGKSTKSKIKKLVIHPPR